MRQVLIAWMAVLLVIAGAVGMASADEGILILPDGQAKYFKDGEFVSFAVEGSDGVWRRADTGESIRKFFEGPQGVKGSDGVWRDPRSANPAPPAQSPVR